VSKTKVFLLYPCGKLFEIRVPINTLDDDGNKIVVLPGEKDYFKHATKKFQINNLKIIECEHDLKDIKESMVFISLIKKVRSI
jgi:hypothetical protein